MKRAFAPLLATALTLTFLLVGCAQNEYIPVSTPAPITDAKIAADTTDNAFWQVFLQLCDWEQTDITEGDKYIALDTTNIPTEITEKLIANVQTWAEEHNRELLLDTLDGLTEKGYIETDEETGFRIGFKEGFAVRFPNVEVGETRIIIDGEVYRGNLGGSGSTFTFNFTDGEWVMEALTSQWIA
jgi:hypothetical protein